MYLYIYIYVETRCYTRPIFALKIRDDSTTSDGFGTMCCGRKKYYARNYLYTDYNSYIIYPNEFRRNGYKFIIWIIGLYIDSVAWAYILKTLKIFVKNSWKSNIISANRFMHNNVGRWPPHVRIYYNDMTTTAAHKAHKGIQSQHIYIYAGIMTSLRRREKK